MSIENHDVQCNISSFTLEVNNYLADVISQLALIYIPLLTFPTKSPAVSKDPIPSSPLEQGRSLPFTAILHEAYNVQCYLDNCVLCAAQRQSSSSDVELSYSLYAQVFSVGINFVLSLHINDLCCTRASLQAYDLSASVSHITSSHCTLSILYPI